jgi:hypothetical protein
MKLIQLSLELMISAPTILKMYCGRRIWYESLVSTLKKCTHWRTATVAALQIQNHKMSDAGQIANQNPLIIFAGGPQNLFG